jgi:hypothetical protein
MLGDVVAPAEPQDSHRPIIVVVMPVDFKLATVAAWLLVDETAAQGGG